MEITQEIIDELFETNLGQQCLCLYSTSDGKVWIRYEEATENSTKLENREIKQWFPSN